MNDFSGFKFWVYPHSSDISIEKFRSVLDHLPFEVEYFEVDHIKTRVLEGLQHIANNCGAKIADISLLLDLRYRSGELQFSAIIGNEVEYFKVERQGLLEAVKASTEGFVSAAFFDYETGSIEVLE